jgi:hypothetical protein
MCLQGICIRFILAALQLHTLAYAAIASHTVIPMGVDSSKPSLLHSGASLTVSSPNHDSSSPSERFAPDIAPTTLELESATSDPVPEIHMTDSLPSHMDPERSHGRTVIGLSTFGPKPNSNSTENPWTLASSHGPGATTFETSTTNAWLADPSDGPTVVGLPTQDTQPNYDSPDTAETILALLAQAKTLGDTHQPEVQFAEVSTVNGLRWQTLPGCAGKGFGWVNDPEGPSCRYFCLGAEGLGVRMRCTEAVCFDLPTPVYPSGSCIVCPAVSSPPPRCACCRQH